MENNENSNKCIKCSKDTRNNIVVYHLESLAYLANHTDKTIVHHKGSESHLHLASSLKLKGKLSACVMEHDTFNVGICKSCKKARQNSAILRALIMSIIFALSIWGTIWLFKQDFNYHILANIVAVIINIVVFFIWILSIIKSTTNSVINEIILSERKKEIPKSHSYEELVTKIESLDKLKKRTDVKISTALERFNECAEMFEQGRHYFGTKSEWEKIIPYLSKSENKQRKVNLEYAFETSDNESESRPSHDPIYNDFLKKPFNSGDLSLLDVK